MSKVKFLGEFEIVVMAALARLGDNAYGVTIIAEIEKRAGRKTSIGALYATLSRLEQKNYVQARMGEATAERGGRAKKYYRITAEGQAQFDNSVAALRQMLNGLPAWPEGALA
jgi:PadR family transcriptional regulator, regulatory protein PadR